MSAAEAVWNARRPSEISLVQQFDYYGKLSAQFPIQRLHVVYAASGTIPAACLLRGSAAAIEHAVYWAQVPSENEGHYLVALLNSETARARVAAIQARGQWGARHFDKVMFTLPIPRFDATVLLHNDLAAAAAEAERLATAFGLPETVKFQRARRLIRDALAEAGIATQIDRLVAQLLDGTPLKDPDSYADPDLDPPGARTRPHDAERQLRRRRPLPLCPRPPRVRHGRRMQPTRSEAR